MTEARGSFAIEPRGAFSLDSCIRFLEGFTPAGYEAASAGTLDAAFALEGSWQVVGVRVEQMGSGQMGSGQMGSGQMGSGQMGSGPVGGEVRGRVFAEHPVRRAELSAVRAQVERILSLDVDGGGFAEVGERDPVIGAAQARYPGLRPVCFWSWYEAAAWAIIGQRMRMSQAAVVKQRLAAELGDTVVIDGVAHQAFPAPVALAELTGGPGLTGAKVERLRALAEAAQRNVFDSATLRALPREEALELLQTLPGVGPFSAELILLRGAGDPDHAPEHEARLARAIAHAYRLDAAPDATTVAELTAGWAPYRTWATLLLRAQLEEDTREIANAGRPTAG
ncbi:DNA-3-methyladenine glycosylase [Herbiconiux sp. P17]|uniref:DNA-3-methyladenine glycosylase family protein n=1 Tax=Herbiconiux wuyangfengii TaxID=3342794 RepID=UPI0035B94DBB